MNMQCFKKNDFWAACLPGCSPGRNPLDKNESWTCEPLGPRSQGLALKGFPSLFCFAVFRTTGYELDLLGAQQAKGAGIFACDEYSLLTADGSTMIGQEKTIAFQGAPIVTSIDNTAGNTWLFVNAWKKVIEIGKWSNHAFTAKVDPDAVFIPEKLRWHVGPHVGERMFIKNCPAHDMTYGALEVFSYAAIGSWATRNGECNTNNAFGEDKYMTFCMETLGVIAYTNGAVVGDKLCGTYRSCDYLPDAAFHPFKEVDSWMQCWTQAMNAIGAATTR